MSGHRASVVVCCYNRGARVLLCLESLASMEFRDFELVLVDDGSTDDTGAVLTEFCGRHPEISSTVVRLAHNSGVSAARNAGIGKSSAELVFFTDSDCEVDSLWLGSLVSAFDRADVDAVAGVVDYPAPRNWTERAYAGRSRGGGFQRLARALVGGNMGFRRQVLQRFLFDEALVYGCDEDDLAWRMKTEGCTFAFVPEAVVLHRHPMTFPAYLGLAFRQGRGSARFWYKKGVFVGRDLLFALLALLTMPLGLLDAKWLVLPGLFVLFQLVALFLNQAVLQGKGVGEALLVLPIEVVYSGCKMASVLITLIGIMCGRDSGIHESKRRWWKRCQIRRNSR